MSLINTLVKFFTILTLVNGLSRNLLTETLYCTAKSDQKYENGLEVCSAGDYRLSDGTRVIVKDQSICDRPSSGAKCQRREINTVYVKQKPVMTSVLSNQKLELKINENNSIEYGNGVVRTSDGTVTWLNSNSVKTCGPGPCILCCDNHNLIQVLEDGSVKIMYYAMDTYRDGEGYRFWTQLLSPNGTLTPEYDSTLFEREQVSSCIGMNTSPECIVTDEMKTRFPKMGINKKL